MNSPETRLTNSLSLHSGGALISYDALCQLATPEARGPRHHPYPFHMFVDNVTTAMEAIGLNVLDARYAVSEDDSRFFGVMALSTTDQTYQPLVGLRGSHDKTISRGIAIGSKVFVCSNLAFSSEQVLSTKQTTNIEKRLPLLIDKAVNALPALLEGQANVFDMMREIKLTDRQADALMTEIVRRDILPSSKFYELIHEWDNPTFEHGNHTLWRMFNATTQVLKPKSDASMRMYDTLRARTLRLTTLCDEVVMEA